jgi:hypothetical protein
MSKKAIFVIATLVVALLLVGFGPVAVEESSRLLIKQKKHSERGIYITHSVAQMTQRFGSIRAGAKRAGINTLVIDVKPIIGKGPLAAAKNHTLKSYRASSDAWLSQLCTQLHAEGFIVSARIPVFKDDWLAIYRPDLALDYLDRKGGHWLNPYKDEARLFNSLIAEIAANSGVDEVQFDYIRFPAEGNMSTVVFSSAETKGLTRVDIICQFLDETKKRLQHKNVSMAVDIFGVVAWQSKGDINALGQDLKRMGKYLDVLAPMLYPSHFHDGYDGFANPGSEPYHFMNVGVVKSLEILSGEAVTLVPWIQGFNMKSPNYGPDYILQQVKACEDAGVKNFLIWNASNNYDVSFNALAK